jgi:hypothetical protein
MRAPILPLAVSCAMTWGSARAGEPPPESPPGHYCEVTDSSGGFPPKLYVTRIFDSSAEPEALTAAWREFVAKNYPTAPVTVAHCRQARYLAMRVRTMQDLGSQVIEAGWPPPSIINPPATQDAPQQVAP